MADDILSQLWSRLNTPLVDWRLPATAPRAPQEAPKTVRSAIQQAITQRPTTVRGNFKSSNLAALRDMASELTTPLNLVSMAAPAARALGPAARLVRGAALAADVAQGVPAAVQGVRTGLEGFRNDNLGQMGAGAVLAALGGAQLAGSVPRAARVTRANRAFARNPLKIDETGQLNPQHPLTGGREDFAILTSEGPRSGSPVMSVDDLAGRLERQGYSPLRSAGVWAGASEPSLVVPGMTPEDAVALADELQQTATITRRGLERTDDPIQRAILGGRVSVPRAPITDGYTDLVDPATNVPERVVLDIPEYDASLYGSSGVRRVAPSARVPERPLLRIEHRTAAPELLDVPVGEEADILPRVSAPFFKGGVPGAERKRASSYPKNYVGRLYATLGKGQVEPSVRALPATFMSEVPAKGVYDAAKDPLNLMGKVQARLSSPTAADRHLRGLAATPQLVNTLFEEEVAKRGFLGLTYGDLPNTFMTKGWEGAFTGPTTPRTLPNLYRDQLMLFNPTKMKRVR
jgi:hypothetical protein